jgi:SAM-dependent methyltransferase
MTIVTRATNEDRATVDSFGEEWARFDQAPLGDAELDKMFAEYFSVFPWGDLPAEAAGVDVGCGSGRWADRVAPRVGHLHCLDASEAALAVARRNLARHANVSFACASVANMPIAAGSLDFCYSLGVLHHVPDTAAAVVSCARLLKPGAPMLLYLYYALDNRPWWYRLIWRASDVVRGGVSRLPAATKARVTDLIALTVYWPMSRLAKALACLGLPVGWLPLAHYRDHSLYTLRTDARDRFGTPLEHRFTLPQIKAMMAQAGLEGLVHSPAPPYWCVVGRKARHE